MKILVVDNHTLRLTELHQMLYKYCQNIDTISVTDLDRQYANDYDLVVLTGATGFAVTTNMDGYKEEFMLVRERTKPMLGICAGFEVIAVSYGADLQYRKDRVEGIIETRVVDPDVIFEPNKVYRVHEYHKYYINEVPPEFKVLSKSEFNIEAIKHKTKPIYGFQFHPEVTEPLNDGESIFTNFFKNVVLK